MSVRRTGSLGLALAVSFALATLLPAHPAAQGRCMLTPGTPACNTADVPPVFAPTGWKTIALDHLTIHVADPEKEAAFYVALMGWTLRGRDAGRVVLDIGDWGTAVFEASSAGEGRAVVSSFCFVIDKWDRGQVETALRSRGLAPVADNDGRGFESFHVKDPDGFDLQIGNSNGFVKARRGAAPAKPSPLAVPFDATGWRSVWLDHISFSVTNYKQSTSFYTNLLGWQTTYDEGSQNECLAGDVGDVVIRGGNPLDPNFGRGRGGAAGAGARGARIDHISFGIQPWDTDGVKAALEQRGLRAQIDTSSRHQAPDGSWVPDEIHTAAFKSYHTQTPNGFNLQISYVTKENRLALANAVRPKGPGG